jgi:hypothetical protein
LTPEQEALLQKLDVELALADRQLRLALVRKQIAETEIDVIALQHTLRQQLPEKTGTETSVVYK